MHYTNPNLFLFASCAVLSAINPLFSADYTWSGEGENANFNNADNWVEGAFPAGGGSTYHTYTFTGSTPQQNPALPGGSTSTSNWLASSIVFTETAASFNLGTVTNQTTNRFQMGNGGTIIQNSASDQTITAVVYLPSGWSTTVSGDGAGSLTLASVRMQPNGSVLNVLRQLTLGDVVVATAGGTSKISVGAGGDLAFSGVGTGQLENLELGVSAPGTAATIRAGNAAGLTSNASIVMDTAVFAGSYDMTFTGNVRLNGSSSKTLRFTDGGTTNFTSSVQLGAANGTAARTVTFEVADGATADFSGGITGDASTGTTSLVKDGGGEMIISGTNSDINGNIRVSDGTLLLDEGYTLGGAQRLDGIGRIVARNGDLVLQDTASLEVNGGDGTGVVEFELQAQGDDVAFILGAGTTVQLDIWSEVNYERVVFGSGFSAINLAGIFVLSSDFADWAEGQEFILFNWADNSLVGAFDSLVLPDVSAWDLQWNSDGFYTSGKLSLEAVPEPLSTAFIGALAVSAVVALRRRRNAVRR